MAHPRDNDAPLIGCALPPPPPSVAEEIAHQLQMQYGPHVQRDSSFRYNPHAARFYPMEYQKKYSYGSNAEYWYDAGRGYVAPAQSVYKQIEYANVVSAVAIDGYYTAPALPSSPGTPAASTYHGWPSYPQYAQYGHHIGWGVQQNPGFGQPPPSGPRDHQTSHPPRRKPHRPSNVKNVESSMPYRRPLVGAPLGSPDKRVSRPNAPMEPVSAYLEHMQDYEEKYPVSPNSSSPNVPSHGFHPFTQRRVPGIRPDQAASFIPAHRTSFDQADATRDIGDTSLKDEGASDDTLVAGSPDTNDYQAYQKAVPMDPWAPIVQELAKQAREEDEARAHSDSVTLPQDHLPAAVPQRSHGNDLTADLQKLMAEEEARCCEEPDGNPVTKSEADNDMSGMEVEADVMHVMPGHVAPVQADENVQLGSQHQRSSEYILKDDNVSKEVLSGASGIISGNEQTITALPEKVETLEDTVISRPVPSSEEPVTIAAREGSDHTPQQQEPAAETHMGTVQPEQAPRRKRNNRSRWNRNKKNKFNNTAKTPAETYLPRNTRERPVLSGAWGANVFAQRINEDDECQRQRNLEQKARQGEDFRPEIRETFKDKKGAKEVALHEKVAGKGTDGNEESMIEDQKDVKVGGETDKKAGTDTLFEPVESGAANLDDPNPDKSVARVQAVIIEEGASQEGKDTVALVEAESGTGDVHAKREESSGSESGGGIKIEGQ